MATHNLTIILGNNQEDVVAWTAGMQSPPKTTDQYLQDFLIDQVQSLVQGLINQMPQIGNVRTDAVKARACARIIMGLPVNYP